MVGGGLLLGVSPTSSLVRFRVAYPLLILLLDGALNPPTRPIVDKPSEEFALVIGRIVLGPDVVVLDKVRLDLALLLGAIVLIGMKYEL